MRIEKFLAIVAIVCVAIVFVGAVAPPVNALPPSSLSVPIGDCNITAWTYYAILFQMRSCALGFSRYTVHY